MVFYRGRAPRAHCTAMAEVSGLKSQTLGCAARILSIVRCAEAETGILTAQKLLLRVLLLLLSGFLHRLQGGRIWM